MAQQSSVAPPDPRLSARLTEAFAFALALHRDQARKGTRTPYVAHLLSVAGIVLTHGGDEEEAISALLHDAVEDQGGAPTLAEIRRRFGDRVATIVDECSDADTQPKPPWRERKEAYLARLPAESASARLVSAADKLDNARAILADYRGIGHRLWARFQGGRDGTLWYYRSLADIFSTVGPPGLASELNRVVAELEETVAATGDSES